MWAFLMMEDERFCQIPCLLTLLQFDQFVVCGLGMGSRGEIGVECEVLLGFLDRLHKSESTIINLATGVSHTGTVTTHSII